MGDLIVGGKRRDAAKWSEATNLTIVLSIWGVWGVIPPFSLYRKKVKIFDFLSFFEGSYVGVGRRPL